MNILDIKYCAQDLQFEEQAYQEFTTYEQELKNHFFGQADGQEIFEDVQLRICEMLQSKMKASGKAITSEDISSIRNSIGEVNQLEESEEEKPESNAQASSVGNGKKLYRSTNDKMIAGVCGGLGNYFSIDPLAFRLLFGLVTVMTNGFGLLVYIIFWIALKPMDLPMNLSKRLYRNKADKVIAGVCGGLASFFKTEAWIVRIIFLSPIILNVTMGGIFNLGINIFNGSAMGFVIIAYIVLWITTKESETPTEELLAKGEQININSISEQSLRSQNNPDANSGINNVLRVIAFIIIGLSLIGILFMLIALLFGSVFMLPMTNAVLHTQLLKWLGLLSILFFIVTPMVGIIIWGIRRMSGIKGPSKVLRISFGGLWALGLASAITLSALLLGEMNKESSVVHTLNLPVIGDTLYVNKLENNSNLHTSIRTNSIFSNFFEEEGDKRMSRLVHFKTRTSHNDSFYVKTKISAVGKGMHGAEKNASIANYQTNFVNGNELYLSKYLTISKDRPYRFQNADVTIYVPKGKKAVMANDLREYKFGNKFYRIETDNDWDDLTIEEKEEVKRDIADAMDEVEDAVKGVTTGIKEVVNDIDIDDKISKEVKQQIRDAEKEAEKNIAIEKQKLRIKKEQLRLEKLEEEFEKN